MRNTREVPLRCGFLVALLIAGQTHASSIQIRVDTSSLLGTSAALAFDLIDGGPPPNAVSIFGFASDGTLGAIAPPTGGVTGTLPGTVTIADTDFFNEYFQNITLGTSLRFVFDTTGRAAAPGSVPDAFSFFFIDPVTGLPFPTNDPTGALFNYNIGEADPLQVFSDSVRTEVISGPNGAPEPGTIVLVIAGLLALAVARAGRNFPMRQNLLFV